MFNHAPDDYACPFCMLVDGHPDGHNTLDDVVYKNEMVTAFVAPKWWIHNHGNVLVIPNKHYENIYDIPDNVLAEIYSMVKRLSIAIRETYGCDGTSTRQHNEPAGNQFIWHFHAHVFPRYENDKLYENHANKSFASPEERAPYVKKLRAWFKSNPVQF